MIDTVDTLEFGASQTTSKTNHLHNISLQMQWRLTLENALNQMNSEVKAVEPRQSGCSDNPTAQMQYKSSAQSQQAEFDVNSPSSVLSATEPTGNIVSGRAGGHSIISPHAVPNKQGQSSFFGFLEQMNRIRSGDKSVSSEHRATTNVTYNENRGVNEGSGVIVVRDDDLVRVWIRTKADERFNREEAIKVIRDSASRMGLDIASITVNGQAIYEDRLESENPLMTDVIRDGSKLNMKI